MKRDYARLVVRNSTQAIELMTEILSSRDSNNCSDEEFNQLHRTIGMLIGELQVEAIDVACKDYPEFNEIK